MSRLVPDSAWAALTIYGEARGEPYEGKVAVAEVIRNRVQRHYNCDGSVPGACLAPVQFSCWNSVDKNRVTLAKADAELLKDCIKAWDEAQRGSDTVKGAVLYVNPYIVTPAWIKACVQVATIGKHTFYVPKEWTA